MRHGSETGESHEHAVELMAKLVSQGSRSDRGCYKYEIETTYVSIRGRVGPGLDEPVAKEPNECEGLVRGRDENPEKKASGEHTETKFGRR